MLKAYSIFKDYSEDAKTLLKSKGIHLDIHTKNERPNKKELNQLLINYDILIIGVKDKFTNDMLEKIKTHKIIATLSIGLDHIDKSFFESEFITVLNCPTANVTSVAEHIFSLILSLNKRIIESNTIALNGGNKTNLSNRPNDIGNKKLGLIGAGKISRATINIARAFNMEIYCNTINPNKHEDLKEQGIVFVDLDTLLSESDIIAVNIPLTEDSKNLISKEKINLMKKNATFINTSRASIVDIKALIDYADDNPQFNVGLDIDSEFYLEILNKNRNNVIITPHIAGVTKEAIDRMDIELTKNIIDNINLCEVKNDR